MKHPFWWALGAGVVVVLVAMAQPLWLMVQGGAGGGSGAPGASAPGGNPAASPSPAAPQAAAQGAARVEALPWQVQALPDGSGRALGLHLGVDTLAQVRATLGEALQVALVARLDEVGALEALAEPFSAGFVAGRLVLSFDVPAAQLRAWRAGSERSEPMDGGVRRFALRAEHRAQADAARLVGLSFIPGVRLTEDDVRQRFGPPASRQALDGGALLLRYPALGVAVTVAPGQRGLVQYVAPRDGARLGLAP